MFLNAEEIIRLTGRKRPTAQCRFLSREGYRFRVNAFGEPIVLEAEVRRRFGIEEAPASRAKASKEADLDWRAMVKRGMVRRRGPDQNA